MSSKSIKHGDASAMVLITYDLHLSSYSFEIGNIITKHICLVSTEIQKYFFFKQLDVTVLKNTQKT